VFNDLFLLAPAMIAAVLLWSGARPRGPGALAVALGAAPFVLLALLIRNLYPGQGALRDWDTFTSAGVFLAALAALAAARAAERDTPAGRLALALAAACAVHTAGWIAVNASPEAAVARVEAAGRSEPALPRSSRAMLYEFLGQLWQEAHQPARSAEAYLTASSLAPNARFFMLAGLQLWDAGDHAGAEKVFLEGASRDRAFRDRLIRLTDLGLQQNPADSLSIVMRRAVLAAAPPALHLPR
jgi:hypothetical protein